MFWWVGGALLALGGVFLFARVQRNRRLNVLIDEASSRCEAFMRMASDGSSIGSWVWQEPYLVGYLTSMIAALTDLSGERLTTEEKGSILLIAVSRASGPAGEAAMKSVVDLQRQQSEAYFEGSDHAILVHAVRIGRLHPALLENEDLQEAGVIDVRNVSEATRSAMAQRLLMHYMIRFRQASGQSLVAIPE